MSKNTVVRILLAVIVLFSLSSFVRPAQAEPEVTWRIMPFGDSITTSVGDHYNSFSPQASYRYWLDHDLHTAAIPFEFMGTQINNYGGAPKYSDFDHHHEGWSGFTTGNFLDKTHDTNMDLILSSFRNGTTEPNIPDMVLLHMGTNDVLQGIATATSKANLSTIIDKFRGANPNVIIFLAEIIPCDPAKIGSKCNNIPTFNQMIPTLAAQKYSAISPVIVVDQYSGFNATAGKDTFDGVHPNESGEIKMANKWLTVIQAMSTYSPLHTYIPSVLA